MKLVLLHTRSDPFGSLAKSVFPALLPVQNKPIAQHQIEQAYQHNLRDVALIVSDGLNDVNTYFHDGVRFGVNLAVLIGARSGDECESLLKHRFLFDETLVVVAGLVMAKLNYAKLADRHARAQRPISLIRERQNGRIVAVILSPASDRLLDGAQGPLFETLAMDAESSSSTGIIEVDDPAMAGEGLTGLLDLNLRLLRQPDLAAHSTYVEERPGVFVGRLADVHPKARLVPPVLIGHHTQVIAEAEVGPNAVIGDDTVVARRAKITNSVVASHSYIGEMTRVSRAFVAENMLFTFDFGTRVLITDSFLLGSMSRSVLSDWMESLIQRGMAMGLLVGMAPLGVAASLIQRKNNESSVIGKEVLGKGVVETPDDLTYLPRFQMLHLRREGSLLARWPALINVLKGDMRLVGPSPLTAEESLQACEEWMLERYRLSPGWIEVGNLGDDELEKRILETVYAKKRSLLMDAKIVVGQLVKPLWGKRRTKRFVGL